MSLEGLWLAEEMIDVKHEAPGCPPDPESHHLFTTMAISLLNSSLGFSIPRTGPQLASSPPISPGSVTLLLTEASPLIIPVFFLHANVVQTKRACSPLAHSV